MIKEEEKYLELSYDSYYSLSKLITLYEGEVKQIERVNEVMFAINNYWSTLENFVCKDMPNPFGGTFCLDNKVQRKLDDLRDLINKKKME